VPPPGFEEVEASVAPEQAAPDGPIPQQEIRDPPEALFIPAGAQVTVELEAPLSTETHMAGDVFFSRVVEDVLAEDGMVLIPNGTRVRGVVTESAESNDSDREPVLRLEVRQLLLSGVELDIDAEILRADVRIERGDSEQETAAKVATGAAAGALLGRILGRDAKGAVKGAIAGAIAGGAVAYVSRDGHARIGEGTLILMRILDRVPLPEVL
jgi:hypothetical protein